MIVIAGGTGRLGSEIANRLAAAGESVRVVSRGLTPAAQELDPRVQVVTGDVRDRVDLGSALDGATVVVSAVQGFVSPGGATPENTDRDGNFALIDAAEAAGADFVLMSVTNPSPDSPMELYRMKYAAEEHLTKSGCSWTVVRADAFTQAWVGIMDDTSGKSGRPLIFGRCDNPIGFVDVRNVAELVVEAVRNPALRGRVLDICGPNHLTLRELAATVMKHRGVGGHPRRIPRPVLQVAANTAGRLKPALGRQMRAALAMDVLPRSDDSATRAEFPEIGNTSVVDVLSGA